jgi:hypothetical protein
MGPAVLVRFANCSKGEGAPPEIDMPKIHVADTSAYATMVNGENALCWRDCALRCWATSILAPFLPPDELTLSHQLDSKFC